MERGDAGKYKGKTLEEIEIDMDDEIGLQDDDLYPSIDVMDENQESSSTTVRPFLLFGSDLLIFYLSQSSFIGFCTILSCLPPGELLGRHFK